HAKEQSRMFVFTRAPRASCVALTVAAVLTASVAATAPAAPADNPERKGPKERQTIETRSTSLSLLAISPDNKTLFVTSGLDVQAWDVASGKLRYTVAGLPARPLTPHPFSRPVVSPDGKTMAFAAGDVYVIDLEKRKARQVIRWPRPKVDPDTGASVGP